MKTSDILKLLKSSDLQQATKFANYIVRTANEKTKTGQLKNPWMQKKTAEQMADLFLRVEAEGLVFDGIHITLQSTGVSYDYIAYKNKMLNVYPESKIDLGIVYKGDLFTVKKESGKLFYTHKLKEPFNQTDSNVVGVYCIIKNKRGEFDTLLSTEEIQKHRKIAKTDYIWSSWYKEMCLKTGIKKACKVHFEDIYHEIEIMDNENYDLEKDVSKKEIDMLQRDILEQLETYQGEDVESIREICVNKFMAGEFTVEFANNILNQIKS